MNKKINKIIASLMVGLIVAPITISAYKRNDSSGIARNLNIFSAVTRELNNLYVDTINNQKMMETAMGAMLRELDPYTEYIPAKMTEDFMTVSTGEYGGIGSYIQKRDSVVIISEPQMGTPSALAGMKAGDKIIMIDTVNTVGMESDKVSKLLKGTPKTNVVVKVIRPYVQDSIKTFTLTREKINVNPVPYYGKVKGKIGYINISTFNAKTGESVREAVLKLKADPEVEAIALDLQGNGGGLLSEAIDVLSMFVPKGTEVLQSRGRQLEDTKVYKTTKKPIDTKIPLFVLIDGGSASASEIVSGALQDLDRAVIIGSRSFGKGLVQTTRDVGYGSMLKVTIAKYYIPSGRLIQELDYSHRNPDGTAKTLPDSLARVFKTAHGREVREGTGITPDIKVEFEGVNRLTYNIMRDNWAFDFVTKYVSEHPSVPSPEEFKVTDEIFNEFKASIDPSRFSYDKVCEVAVKELRKVAKTEGYDNDSVKAQFDILERLLKHDLNHDLDQNRKAIEEILSSEIMRRYYYEPGVLQNAARDHKCLDKVLEIMDKQGEYARILNLVGKKD